MHPGNHFSQIDGDYFAFSFLLMSAAFILIAIADFIHRFVLGVAVAIRTVSFLALLAGGVVFLAGGVYMISGPSTVAFVVGLLLLTGFGTPYLQWHKDKRRQDLT